MSIRRSTLCLRPVRLRLPFSSKDKIISYGVIHVYIIYIGKITSLSKRNSISTQKLIVEEQMIEVTIVDGRVHIYECYARDILNIYITVKSLVQRYMYRVIMPGLSHNNYLCSRLGLTMIQPSTMKTVMVMEEDSPLAAASLHLYMLNQFSFPSTRFRNSASSLCPSK